MMLTLHTVRWFDVTDDTETPHLTVYVTPGHHDERSYANEMNDIVAKNRPNYDDACAMGRAAILSHTKEPYHGEA